MMGVQTFLESYMAIFMWKTCFNGKGLFETILKDALMFWSPNNIKMHFLNSTSYLIKMSYLKNVQIVFYPNNYKLARL